MPTTVRKITCKSALTKTGGFLSEYTHTLQPYTGCVFGCPYCYVQALPVHRYHGGAWGSYVDVKINAPDVLAHEMAKHHKRENPVRIFMSSATDPYQGAEAKHRITRGCLETFLEYKPELVVVQTRSPMVRRDFDLLAQIDSAVLSMTIETDDETVLRTITPGTPSLHHRLATLEAAMTAGLRVQTAVSPILPNDPESFAALLKDRCHRVVIDTYFDGDGADGKRTERLGIRALYDQHGYGAWYFRDAHQRSLETFREVLGAERVVYSKEGFNSVEWVKAEN